MLHSLSFGTKIRGKGPLSLETHISGRLLTAITFSMLANCPFVDARCIDVVDVATELPHHELTPNRTGVSYVYDLEKEQYLISWDREHQRGGPYGPFTLTRGCAPARPRWESSEFLLFQAGCGTFCWYLLALPLANTAEQHQRFERPLAFDQTRNLLAYYYAKDIIRIKSLLTGHEQDIRTMYECETASGLCFEAVRFTTTELQYTWRYNPAGRILAVSLHDQLIDSE